MSYDDSRIQSIYEQPYPQEEVAEKLKKANAIVKKEIAEEYGESTWQYIDFVKEDRFMDEIIQDGFNLVIHSAEEIAQYAIDNIEL